MKEKFDLNNVVTFQLLKEPHSSEVGTLFREMREAVTHSQPVKKLVDRLMVEAYQKNGGDPESCMKLALLYGVVIGVLVEKERIQRRGQLIIPGEA